MQGVKTISRKLGFGQAPMPLHDPDVSESICPLCGVFGPVNKMGWCYDHSCKKRARQELRRQAAESPNGIVEGQYYKIGDVELMNLTGFETHADPITPIKHPDLCTQDQCEVWARPQDNLCPEHRLQTNAARHQARRTQRQGKARKQKGRNKQRYQTQLGNGIRGLDKLAK